MAAQQLNVRVGLLFDEKSLANLERQMRSSGQRLSKIGTDLTLSLSLPLAAFGVSAIKAAGDFESLTLALKSQLGTADAAAKELDNLTKSALKPGIGLEQAVRGSVRLQAVGLSADEARRTIEEMGNAVASTGGTAQELDGVTKQFAQIISKGRVLQEDISVLSENLPAIAGLMKTAFGTSNVDAIQKMGISGKEFVFQITKAAEELKRVDDGIKNGIGNAIDSLTRSASKVGLAINEAFDVTGAIESVSGAVLALAQGFSALPVPIQKVILGLAGIAIATGPILKGYGAIQTFGSQLVKGWGFLVTAIKPVIVAFRALHVATQAFILVGVIAAVLLFVDAFKKYQSQLTQTQIAQNAVNDAIKNGQQNAQEQKTRVDLLVSSYKNESTTLGEKKKILNQLKEINPEYFGQLKTGKGDVDALTLSTKKYIEQLDKSTTLQALTDEIVKQKNALINVKDQFKDNGYIVPVIAGLVGISKAFTDIGYSGAYAQVIESTYERNLANSTGAIQNNIDALQKKYEEVSKSAAATGNLADEYKDLGGASDGLNAKLKTLAEVLSDVANAAPKAALIGDDESEAKIEALRKGIVKLIDAGFKPASAEVLNLKTQLDSLNEKPTDVVINIIKKEGGGGIADLAGGDGKIPARTPNLNPIEIPPITGGLDLQQQKDLANSWRDTFINAAQEIAGATFSILGNANAARFEAEKEAAIAAADAQLLAAEGNAEKQAQIRAGLSAKIAQIEKKEGKRKKALAIAEAVVNTAVAVTKAIASAAPPLNVPAIVAASIAGAAQIAVIAATPFARGTAYAPGGTALVGEQGPELINLPRGSQVFPTPKTNAMLSGMGGGNMNVSGEFTVRGTDLVLVLERTQNKNERFR